MWNAFSLSPRISLRCETCAYFILFPLLQFPQFRSVVFNCQFPFSSLGLGMEFYIQKLLGLASYGLIVSSQSFPVYSLLLFENTGNRPFPSIFSGGFPIPLSIIFLYLFFFYFSPLFMVLDCQDAKCRMW